ncbi:MAG TPA: SdrD B-like domain-containing protein [Blastocatellia bacterium]|nr:SdrD B-like domain-containing protein [Blastocatellia bacterium]
MLIPQKMIFTAGTKLSQSNSNKRIKRFSLLLIVIAIVAIISAKPREILFSLFPHAEAATSASGVISGNVFHDYNADGAKGVHDLGVQDIEVRAYNASGANVTPGGVVTTNASGNYSLATTDAGTGPYRVEFTIPAAFGNLKSGPSGIGSGTTVQFVSSTPASNVNLGINEPADWCQANPQLAIPCYLIGDVAYSSVSGSPAVVEFAYNSGLIGRTFSPETTASITVTPEVTPLLSSAAPSPSGTGNATPPMVAGRSKIINATLGQVGAVSGVAYHRQTNNLLVAAYMKRFVSFPAPAGWDGTVTNRPNDRGVGTIYLIDRKTDPNFVSEFYFAPSGTDTHAYSSGPELGAGKISGDAAAGNDVGFKGWADIEMTPEGDFLYAVNLFDSSIHMIPVITTGSSITAGNASKISFPSNPCTNNDWRPGGLKVRDGKVYATVTCTAQSSQQVADMRLLVYSFPVGQANPSFTQVGETKLNYNRPFPWDPWNNTNPGNQPWGRDIEFDEAGNMFVGLANRLADANTDSSLSFSLVPGDTIHGTPDGTGAFQFIDLDPEFIDDLTSNGAHPENDHGTLAVVLGTGELIAPALIGNLIDGIRHYNSSIGQNGNEPSPGKPVSYFGLFQTPRNNPTPPGIPFAKANGLGDIEALCGLAPIEVGNRVWKDTNNNGIQDAGEVPISGVTVRLYNSVNSLLATAVTDANGNYYFSSAVGTSTTTAIYGISALKPNTNGFSIKLDNPADYTGSGPLTGVTPSIPTAGSNGSIDSDGVLIGGFSSVTFNTGDPGTNNHNFDFGFSSGTKCDTICFRSPQYWLLHINQLPKGTILIASANGNQPVSTSNVAALGLVLKGNALGFGTLSPLQQFNQEFVAAQLNFLAAGGSGSPVTYNAMWANLSCYGITFSPVTLSNNVTLTVNSMVKELWMQATLAAQSNKQTDFAALAAIFDLLNGNSTSRYCN